MQINYAEINQRALELLLSTKKHLTAIDSNLRALVEIRVSQINGCAYCVDLHTNEARALNEDQQRLDCLIVWKESNLFSAAEAAALDWAEGVTSISTTPDIERRLENLLGHYSESEIVDLTYIVAVMNCLNRMAISLGSKPSKRNV